MARIFRFDCYEVDPAAHRLSKGGARVRLRDQSFQVLVLLLERPGRVVTRDDLRRRLWPGGVFVDFENSLNTAVGRLREALGDSADQPRYLETVPRVGYRFVAPVAEAWVPEAPATAPKARLLVLPFVNLSGEPSQEYFSDAITDEIVTELSALAPADLGVIARTTAMRYKNTDKDVASIAREVSVDWVLEGSVRRSEDHVALTAQLVRAKDQTHVFARRYELHLRDVFNVERSIAHAVGEQIGVVPRGGTQREATSIASRSLRQPTHDLVAYNDYIQGRQHLDRDDSPQLWVKARESLEHAVARDPGFARAHDALAELWWNMGFFGLVPPREALRIGLSHAERAVEIHDSLAHARQRMCSRRSGLPAP